MSLLLKALQNAAKNREAGAAGAEPTPAAGDADNSEISLEPLQASARGPSSRAAASEDTPERPTSGASPLLAQNVLRAGGTEQRAGILDWLARRPLVAFSTAAGLFAIGYGIYLYLQITSPGMFIAQSPVAPPPPPPPGASPAPPAPVPPPPPAALTPPAPLTPVPIDVKSGPQPEPAAATPAVVAPPVTSPAPAASASTAPATTPAAAGTSLPAATPPAIPPAARPSIAITLDTPPPAQRAAPRAAPRSAAAKPAPVEGVTPAAAPQVVAIDPNLAAAYQALEKGQFAEAERLYRQALASDPRSVDAMLGLASTLVQQNRGDAAGQLYMRALEQDPRNPYAQAGLLSLGGRSDPAAAETRLRQLIAREPSAFLYFTLGNLYSEQGQWAAAQGAYFQAHNLAPDNPDYAYNLAIGLEHLSQGKLALGYYRRAVALAQARGHAQFEVARVEARIRSLATALAEKP